MPSASCDWRFLPSMPSGGRVLLLSLSHPDAAVGLLAAYEQVFVVTNSAAKTAVLPPHLAENGRLRWLITDTPAALTLTDFDLVIMPHGFWHAPETDLPLANQWLRLGGTIFVGFNGRWRYSQRTERGWSTRHITQLLHRHGFRLKGTYGIVPNLFQPMLIAPLTPLLIEQWLAHKVRPAWLSSLFQRKPWWYLLTYLLPAYGFVGQKKADNSS